MMFLGGEIITVHNTMQMYKIIPMQIHTDQVRNFESALFQELCRLLGITKTRTALHLESDGMLERFNRTLEEMLSKVVDINHRNWDE